MSPYIRFLFIFFILTFPFQASSETTLIDDEIRKNIASTTAVITFLTSHESVSAGIYTIGKEDNTQSEFSTFKLPYRHAYKEHADTSQWSMLMGYGRFDMHQEYDLTTSKARSNWQANSLNIGIGYSKRIPKDDARWFSRMEVAYTQINHQYVIPASAVSNSSSTPKFGDLPFSWNTDTLSIIPSIGMNIPVSKQFKKLRYTPKLSYVYSQSIFEKDQIEVVSAGSGLLVNRFDFGELFRLKNDSWGFSLNPQINRTDAFGTISEGLSTAHWYEMNLNFILHASDAQTWWDGLSYGFSYLQGNNFSGGQLTISFSLENFATAGQ